MRRFINGEALLQCLVLGEVAGAFLHILLTGQITHYVHPRMVPYIIVALILLGGMLVFGLPDVFKPRHQFRITPSLFLLMALTLLFTSQKAIGQQKEKVDRLGEHTSYKKEQTLEQAKVKETKLKETKLKEAKLKESKVKEAKGEEGEILVIRDEDFGRWYKKIYSEGSAYEGKKIRLKGQVLRVPELGTDEFIPSRRIMICCAADATAYGFVCRSPLASQLIEEEWVMVTGILHWEEYLGEEMPVLEALEIDRVEPPIEEYVTFY